MCKESRRKSLDNPGTVIVCSEVKQMFNGLSYFRHDGEKRYFRRPSNTGEQYLHRVVWIYHNGEIPKGMHIHHKDGNRANNSIENLELVDAFKHLSEHNKNVSQEVREKRLAALRDAQELAKVWHSSPEGRAWHAQHAAKEKKQDKKCKCKWCGKEFLSKLSDSMFCSKNCKTRYRYHSGIDDEIRNCEHCGKPFTANKYSRQKFCSRKCSARHKSGKSKQQSSLLHECS